MLPVVFFLSIPSIFPEFILPLMSSSSLWQGKWRKKEIGFMKKKIKKQKAPSLHPKVAKKWPNLRKQTGLQVNHGHHLWRSCGFLQDLSCTEHGSHQKWEQQQSCFHTVLTRIRTLFKFSWLFPWRASTHTDGFYIFIVWTFQTSNLLL